MVLINQIRNFLYPFQGFTGLWALPFPR